MDGDAGGIIGGIDVAGRRPGDLGRYTRHLMRTYKESYDDQQDFPIAHIQKVSAYDKVFHVLS